MQKLYKEREVLFAVLWIAAYCLVMTPLKGSFGFASPAALLVLIIFAAGITRFVKSNHLEGKYGLAGWPPDMKRYLYFIPMWILATGNLWGGIEPSYHGIALVIAAVSMMLVGYIEEMIFRGFLFRAMLSENKAVTAVIVSAVTFGMGHIVNLLTGQAGFDTVMQMIFAVSLGFIMTMVFYKSGSLIPCIITHALIDVFSLFGADNILADGIYMGVTILMSVVYCIYLSRMNEPGEKNGK